MYNVSDLFKTYIKNFDRMFEAQVDVNGDMYTGTDIVEFNIEDSIQSGDDFTLGTAISSILNISIRTVETIPAGAKIIPYIRLNGSSGTTEWLKLGEYYVDSRVMNNRVWQFTCYDRLIFGQVEYISNLNYPTTMQAVWDEACGLLGTTSDVSVVINPDYTFQVAPTGHMLREVLGYIAAAHVSSVKMTKDGTIGWATFKASSTPVDKITASDYSSAPQTNPSKKFTRIVVKSGSDAEATEIEVGVGEEANTLTLINPYITQSMLNDMYTVFNGFRYIPFTMDWRCFPNIEVGDTIEAEMFTVLTWIEATMPWQTADFPWRDLPTFCTVVLRNKISYKGGLRAVSSASSTSTQQSELTFKGTIRNQLEQLDTNTLKEGKNYYGVTMHRDYGIKVDSTSGSSALFNGDQLSMQANGVDCIYFNTLTGKYCINGTLEAVDGQFSGTVYAEKIDTSNAKIKAAQIETLHIGPNGNVVLDSTATISWGQITSVPDLVTGTQLTTRLGQDYVVTGKIYANQINGQIANLTDSVSIGSTVSATAKTLSFYNSSGNEAKLYMEPGGSLNLISWQSVNVPGQAGVNLYGGPLNNIQSIQLYNYDSAAGSYLIKVKGATKFYDQIAFFGGTPIAQKTASYLASNATQADIITKVNGILGILSQSNYNLVYVT
jgi:hypothetical protein